MVIDQQHLKYGVAIEDSEWRDAWRNLYIHGSGCVLWGLSKVSNSCNVLVQIWVGYSAIHHSVTVL